MTKQNQKIGLLAATSLVVGNIIGAGIFVLPASLGKFGSISIVGWLFTATGALILAKIFSNFSKKLKGNIGSGKTTLTNMLSKHCVGKNIFIKES